LISPKKHASLSIVNEMKTTGILSTSYRILYAIYDWKWFTEVQEEQEAQWAVTLT